MSENALHDPERVSTAYVLLRFCPPVGLVGGVGLALAIVHAPVALLAWLLRRACAPPARGGGAAPAVELVEHAPLLPSRAHARDTVLLVHGFPDSPSLWDGTVDALTRAGYRCLVAALPGARGEAVDAACAPEAMAEALHAALRARERGAVTLLAHDWGAVYGFLLARAHPTAVRRIAAVDVGGHIALAAIPPVAAVGIALYQSLLALAFALGGPGGRLILRGMLLVWRYPRAEQRATVDMCHHYMGAIQAEARKLLAAGGRAAPSLDYTPAVPSFFAYAAHKPFFFHTREWLRRVRATPGGLVVEFACGHWLMTEQPEQWADVLVRWLRRTDALLAPEPVGAHGD